MGAAVGTLIEQRHLALEPLLPHANKRDSALQQGEKADPEQGGGVAFGEGADADSLGVRKADVDEHAKEAGKRTAALRYRWIDKGKKVKPELLLT